MSSKIQKLKGIYTLDRIPFNHEWYGPLNLNHRNKADAKATARVVKKCGIRAKVVETDQGYRVFANENDTKRANKCGFLKPIRRRK